MRSSEGFDIYKISVGAIPCGYPVVVIFVMRVVPPVVVQG